MKNRILVLSSTGNVGIPLVKSLLKKNRSVKAATRGGNVVKGAESVYFDFSDPKSYSPAFDEVESVYIMLPTGYPGGVKTLLPIIDIAVERGMKIVLQTAIEAAFDKNNPYVYIEEYLKKASSNYVILRPTWFMDNFHIFWKDNIIKGELKLPTQEGETAFIDTRDIAKCGAEVLTSTQFNGLTFNLTGKESLSYRKSAEIFSQVLERQINYTSITDEEYIEQLVQGGMSKMNAGFFTHALSEVRNGLLDYVYNDVEKILGVPPRSLVEYISDNKDKFE